MLLTPESQSGSVEFVESRGTISIKFKILARDVTWNIPMERIEATADVKCEFLVRQIAELNVRLSDNSSDNFASRVAKIEKLLGIDTGVRTHVFRAVTVPNYTLSQNRKRVSKNAGTLDSYQAFLSEQPITATSNSFTVVINNLGIHLHIGVAKQETKLQGGIYKNACAYIVYLNQGLPESLSNNRSAEIPIQNKVVACAGSRLIVRFDPTSSRLSFELDGIALLPKLEIAGTNASQLFPVVDLYNAEQSVSFTW